MLPLSENGASAMVALPATCGELFQGTLDGQPCLVSCPINRYAVARVQLSASANWHVPDGFGKAEAALRLAMAFSGRASEGCCLSMSGDLPRGRGYGSSTADIGAVLYALGVCLGRPFAMEEVAHIAVRIEPTDSTVFPGLALFDHRGGGFAQFLGRAPRLAIAVVDPGGEVDTLEFNRRDHLRALARLQRQHVEAFSLLAEGLEKGDPERIGAAASLSALAHQEILSDPLLERVMQLAQQVGAPGVCRAHSGTISGVILHPERADVSDVVRYLSANLAPHAAVTCQFIVDGGPRFLPPLAAGADHASLPRSI